MPVDALRIWEEMFLFFYGGNFLFSFHSCWQLYFEVILFLFFNGKLRQNLMTFRGEKSVEVVKAEQSLNRVKLRQEIPVKLLNIMVKLLLLLEL